MKLDTIEAQVRDSQDVSIHVELNLFFREFRIHRLTDSCCAQAIDGNAIATACFDSTDTVGDGARLIHIVWNMMDYEGKNIMERDLQHIVFGE